MVTLLQKHPECPARELHQFNKFSVTSHLSHTSTTFTGREGWELKHNKPSPNCNKNVDTKSYLQQGGTTLPRSQTQNFSGNFLRVSIRKPALQHKGLTAPYHTRNPVKDRHALQLLPSCIVCIMNRLGTSPGGSEESLVRHK